MLRAIIHNDDFGLTHGFTDAILACARDGITTSTSIRTNGIAYDYAVTKFRSNKRNPGIGLHVNLTDGIGHTTSLPKRNFIAYITSLALHKRYLLPILSKEIRAQFEISIGQSKLPIDHVNGHDHIHMIPPLFEATAKIAKEYNIRYIRLAHEQFYSTGIMSQDIAPFINGNALKFIVLNYFSKCNLAILKRYNIRTVDCFYGILHTGQMDSLAIRGALRHAIANNYQVVEILSHPVTSSKKDKEFTSDFIQKYCAHPSRAIEFAALHDQKLIKFIKKHDIMLTNYRQLVHG